MYILDTNVVSELRKAKPHGAVVAWIESLPPASIFICALTIGEIQIGVERTRKQDPRKADEIESWLSTVIGSSQILPIDAETYRVWATLIENQSNTVYEDALIVACAKRHGFIIATRNTKHFSLFDVPVVNPFVLTDG